MVRARQWLIGAGALVAGAGAIWLIEHRRSGPTQAGSLLALVVGWSFIASGLVVWQIRDRNRLGPVMVATGFAWFASLLMVAHRSGPFTVGAVFQVLYLAGFSYVILTFPSGRLQGVFDRGLFVLVLLDVTLVQLAALLFSDSHAALCGGCPANRLEVARNDALAKDLFQFQRIFGISLIVASLGLLAVRWWRATAPQRRAIAPVLWAGTATLAVLGVSVMNDILGKPLGQAPIRLVLLVMSVVPVAVLVVLFQRRLARGAVAGLVVELGEPSAAADLRSALARTLGDQSLELAYWFPAESRYVDTDGRPIKLPDADADRVATIVERNGQPIAALIHDPALQHNSELVDSVCATAGLTLENERLQAELRARLAELQASRARLVEVTESERRRIERDLHDGTQQRLVSAAMSLGLAESKLPSAPAEAAPILKEAREALTSALAELRELSQGIHPSVLTERGLPAALDDLCRRAALPARLDVRLAERLPTPVETAAYFVVSEALTNAVKHSHATELRVGARREGDLLHVEIADDGIGGATPGAGSGLRGMADRVEALGGSLTVSSPPGRGTTVALVLPCA